MNYQLTAVIILAIVAIVFVVIAAFLGNEMLKKFGFQTEFTNYDGDYVQKIPWNYNGEWTGRAGMKTISFESDQPFALLIGLKLKLMGSKPLYDYYGFIESRKEIDGWYTASISTYLGKDPIEFIFLVKKEGPQQEIRRNYSNESKPDAVYPPHPWQVLSDCFENV